MAIILQFNVMLARKEEIGRIYLGGLAQFRQDWLNKRSENWCEDEHLLAFSSMGWSLKEVAGKLQSLGVDLLQTDQTVKPAEVMSRCGWLDWDVYERIDRKLPEGTIFEQEVVRYWLRGSAPGEVAVWVRNKIGPRG
jgi:hypothetical protein